MGSSNSYSRRGFHPHSNPHPEGRGNEVAERGNEATISVRVQPRASRDRVLGVRDGALRVSVAAPPHDGKANAALLELLAERLGVAKSRLRIARGHSSRNKVVAVAGLASEEVLAKLS